MKSRFSILCLLVNILLISCEQAPQYYEVSGRLHTPYHIKFEHTKPLDKEIDEQLKYFYHLFNAFDSTSVISQVNQNRDIRVDTLFTGSICRDKWGLRRDLRPVDQPLGVWLQSEG